MAAPLRSFRIVCFCRAKSALPRCFSTFSPVFNRTQCTRASWLRLTTTRRTHDQGKRERQRLKFPMIASPLLALTFFGKKKEESPESLDPVREAETKSEEGTKKKKQDHVIFLLKYAKLEEQRQNDAKAEEYYHAALSLLGTYKNHIDWDKQKILQARVWIYDAMANLALSRGKFRTAESCFKDVMKGLLEMDMEKDDDAIIEISLKLAMIYAISKRNEEAEAGYKYCIEAQEKKIIKMADKIDNNSVALHGLCVDAFSRFLMVQKQYKMAIESLQKALSIAIKVFGEIHPQVAVLHNDIATVASLDEDIKLAKDHLEKAIKIGNEVDSHDLPAFYSNMGSLCIRTSEFEEAKLYCEKAIKSAKLLKNTGAVKQAEKCLEAVNNAQKAQSQ